MKYVALGLLLALLVHFPHLAAFLAAAVPVLAIAAVSWALGKPWLLAAALAVIVVRSGRQRMRGWL
ncbi:hypothetical protein [Streptomyces sp. RPT161]|uniref:hypothetical protein n=1 Tax=Streptomyces sp. RPT161 TaxID=3015993 RepID=UPI0022B92F22|nr:hypothetical protein [Streptomyces sp. RPT161]